MAVLVEQNGAVSGLALQPGVFGLPDCDFTRHVDAAVKAATNDPTPATLPATPPVTDSLTTSRPCPPMNMLHTGWMHVLVDSSCCQVHVSPVCPRPTPQKLAWF